MAKTVSHPRVTWRTRVFEPDALVAEHEFADTAIGELRKAMDVLRCSQSGHSGVPLAKGRIGQSGPCKNSATVTASVRNGYAQLETAAIKRLREIVVPRLGYEPSLGSVRNFSIRMFRIRCRHGGRPPTYIGLMRCAAASKTRPGSGRFRNARRLTGVAAAKRDSSKAATSRLNALEATN